MTGSGELARRAVGYLVALAFALTYLASTALGATGVDALVRGALAAGGTLLFGQFFCRPVIDVVLDAVAREESRRAAERAKEDDA